MISIDINPVCNCLTIPPHCVFFHFILSQLLLLLILEDLMMLISCYSLDFLVNLVFEKALLLDITLEILLLHEDWSHWVEWGRQPQEELAK